MGLTINRFISKINKIRNFSTSPLSIIIEDFFNSSQFIYHVVFIYTLYQDINQPCFTLNTLYIIKDNLHQDTIKFEDLHRLLHWNPNANIYKDELHLH